VGPENIIKKFHFGDSVLYIQNNIKKRLIAQHKIENSELKFRCYNVSIYRILLTGNNHHLFADIATTKEANQGCRAILKTLSNVFHIHNLPTSDLRQDKLQEFGIWMVVIIYNKTFHFNPLKYEMCQICYAFWLSKIVLWNHSTNRYSTMESHVWEYCIKCLSPNILKVNVNAFWKVSTFQIHYSLLLLVLSDTVTFYIFFVEINNINSHFCIRTVLHTNLFKAASRSGSSL